MFAVMNACRAGLVGLAVLVLGLLDTAKPAHAKEKFALVIANKAYIHTAPVEFADRDADAIETAFRNVWSIKRRNIRRQNNATGNDLKYLFGTVNSGGTLSSLVRGKDSELIVYFAGHGSKEDGKPYLLGTDTRPDRLALTGYSLNVLLSQLDKFQKEHLPDGRVTVILESCFSGRSHAGELVTGTSAPAFGGPVAITNSMPKEQSNFVVMAAAQGSQYAVWDTEYKQSVFTDALVSGLHGEADNADFGGDADGRITLGELDRFVSQRIGRRLKAVRPGISQRPEIVGGSRDETLVETASVIDTWEEQYKRSYGEELRANLALSNPKATTLRRYLDSCLYCPKRTEIRRALSTIKKKRVSCQIEEPIVERLMASGTAGEIQSFQATCRCCNRKIDLSLRLASLQDGGGVGTVAEFEPKTNKIALAAPVEDKTHEQEVQESKPTKREIALVLQRQLKRVGCYTGRIDGSWGWGSKSALRKFNKYANLSFGSNQLEPATIDAVKKRSNRVCPLVCGRRQVARGGRCVAKTCGSNERLNSRGTCVRVLARKKISEPKSTAKRSKKKLPSCFKICGGGWGTTSACQNRARDQGRCK